MISLIPEGLVDKHLRVELRLLRKQAHHEAKVLVGEIHHWCDRKAVGFKISFSVALSDCTIGGTEDKRQTQEDVRGVQYVDATDSSPQGNAQAEPASTGDHRAWGS